MIRCVVLLWIVVLCVTSGCNQESFEAHRFMLAASRDGGAKDGTGLTLAVRRFHSDSAFAKQGMVLRIGEDQYEEAYYHKFLAPPAELVQDATFNWFVESGAFERVERAESSQSGSLVLDADVVALYGDRRHESVGFMSIRFTLSRVEDYRLIPIFQRRYDETSAWSPAELETLPAALNNCLNEVLKRVETDVLEQTSKLDR